MENKRLSVRIPAELHGQLKLYSRRVGEDMSDIVRDLIARHLQAEGVTINRIQLGERFGRESSVENGAADASAESQSSKLI